MESFFAAFAAWASSHPLTFTLFVWPILTAVVTGAFGVAGHLSSDEFSKLPKPLARLLSFMSAAGIDAPFVLSLLAKLFGRGGGAAAFLLFVGFVPMACDFLKSPGAVQDAGLAVKDVLCILEHDQDDVRKIIVECQLASDTAQVVQQILAGAHAAEARYAAKHGAPDAGPGK